ncbi:MAG: SPASM domain-containing protein [Herbinix sp.]|nr:SPASM domain-containing protein [Herbinix sp.]
MDSYDETSYSNVHRPIAKCDTFSSLYDFIKDFVKLKNKDTRIILSYILDEDSIDGVAEFAEIAKKLKVDGIDIKTEHSQSYSQKKNLILKAKKILAYTTNSNNNIGFDQVKRRRKFINKLWVGLCYQCIIEADGFVYPCCHTIEEKYIIGNINKESFESIWNGSNHSKMIEKFYNQHISCPTCSDSSNAQLVYRALDDIC